MWINENILMDFGNVVIVCINIVFKDLIIKLDLIYFFDKLMK